MFWIEVIHLYITCVWPLEDRYQRYCFYFIFLAAIREVNHGLSEPETSSSKNPCLHIVTQRIIQNAKVWGRQASVVGPLRQEISLQIIVGWPATIQGVCLLSLLLTLLTLQLTIYKPIPSKSPNTLNSLHKNSRKKKSKKKKKKKKEKQQQETLGTQDEIVFIFHDTINYSLA